MEELAKNGYEYIIGARVKNETDDVKNEVTARFDALKKKWADHRNKVYEEKIKEINKGHDKWLVEEGQKK